MGGKKPFIKKGEGVKFYLAHRSQKDPLYLDETLGERVLVPVDPDTDSTLVDAINGINLGKKHMTNAEKEELKQKRLKEQQKFGVYYEDDYDYLQHLRDAERDEKAQLEPHEIIKVGSVLIKTENEDERPKLNLPSTVFASKFEEEVGYFNQAAPDSDPKIGWDPDIVELLDEDAEIDFEDPDNQLDDDFFIKANDLKSSKSNEEDDDDDDEDEDDDEDDDYSDDGRFDGFSESQSVKEFETKSRFSTYSVSSSVIRRNEGLKQLDAHFEKIFAEYDEDQIGALDTDEIEGFRQGRDLVLESALEEFNKLMEKKKYLTEKETSTKASKLAVLREQDEEGEECENDEEGEEETLSEKDSSEEDKKDYDLVRYTAKKDKEDRFDCETIVSTYSNIYNRPAIISDKPKLQNMIKISKKTGLPLGVLEDKPKSKKEMDKIEHKITRLLPEIIPRRPDETKEEKKARKQIVKEGRRERRVEKKINKMAFKQEKKNQISQMVNNPDATGHTFKLPL